VVAPPPKKCFPEEQKREREKMEVTMQRKKPNGRTLSISTIAKILNVDRSTVYRWCVAGKLKAHQFTDGGQFKVYSKDFDKFMEKSEL
jgi:excisionase family DNA binding protein